MEARLELQLDEMRRSLDALRAHYSTPADRSGAAGAAWDACARSFAGMQSSVVAYKSHIVRFGAMRDKTLAEEAIRRRILFTQAKDGIVLLNSEKQVVEANASFAAMLGRTLAEVLPLRPWEWDVLYSTREKFFMRFSRAHAVSDTFETQFRQKNGAILDVEVSRNQVEIAGEKLVFCVCRDISETKRVEAERAREAIRRRILFEQAADGILVIDSDFKVVEANASFSRMLACTPDEVLQWDARAWNAIFSADEETRAASPDAEIVCAPLETIICRKDKSIFDAEIRQNQVMIGGKKHYFCICRDISKRKRIERELRTSEARFRCVIESNMIGIFFWNPDGSVMESNDAFCRIVGYTHDDMRAGRVRWNEMTPPEYAELDQKGIREIEQTGSCAPFEKEYIRKDGVRVPVLVGGSTFPGTPDKGFAFVIDITERRKAYDALRESEARIRLLVRSANIGLWDWNLLTNEVYYSSEWKKQLGFEDHEVSNSFEEWESRCHPDDIAPSLKLVKDFLASDRPDDDHQGEFRMRHRDGSWRWIFFQGTRIRDSAGRQVRLMGCHIDITERKRSEAALRQSEERTRLLMKAANIGLWDWNIPTNGVYFSPEWKKQLGFEDHEIPNDPNECEDRVHPDDLSRTRATVRAFLDSGRPDDDYENEFRMRHKDGTWRWLLSRATRIRDASGKQVRMIGCHIDLTDHKRAEAALRKSEERFRAYMDHSPAAAWFKDSEGRILYVNALFERVFQRKLADIYGKKDDELWPEAIARQLRDNDRYVLRTHEPLATQEILPLPNGELRHWLTFKFPLVDVDGGELVCGMALDITERKRTEEALIESEERYRRIVQTAEEGIWTIDAAAHTSFVNPKMAQMLGYTVDEMTGHALNEFMDDEGRAISERNIARRQQGITEQHEFKLQRKDGSDLWTWMSTNPILDANGVYVGALAMVTDISERKRAEAERERLLKEVQDSSERLGIASRQLISVQETERRNLARELHDEIGQLLTAINLQLQVAKQHAIVPLAIARIDDALGIAARLVQQVRERSLSLRPSMLDDFGLAAALRWYAGSMSKSGKFAVHLDTVIPDGRLPAEVETAAFRIVQEAMTNAARHSQAADVWIEIIQDDGHVDINVRDNGVGFDPATARQRALLGTSTGLFGIMERVELLGGKFTLDSQPGKGTSIHVCFDLNALPK